MLRSLDRSLSQSGYSSKGIVHPIGHRTSCLPHSEALQHSRGGACSLSPLAAGSRSSAPSSRPPGNRIRPARRATGPYCGGLPRCGSPSTRGKRPVESAAPAPTTNPGTHPCEVTAASLIQSCTAENKGYFPTRLLTDPCDYRVVGLTFERMQAISTL